jgi:hypothetical protein
VNRAFVFALVARVVVLAAGLVGCTRTTDLVAPQADGRSDGQADGNLDAQADGQAPDGQPRTCPAPVHLGGTAATACAGAIAAQLGRFALCSCNDIVVPGSLIVNRVGAQQRLCKSQSGPSTGPIPGPWGPCDGPTDGPNYPKTPTFFAAVGSDGTLQTGSHADLPGSLFLAGTDDVRVGAQGHVLGAVHVAGNLRPNAPYWITGDAFVGGDVVGQQISVGQALHTPAASVVQGVQAMSGVVREPVTVLPPCNCAAGPAFDVTAAVDARRTANDNAAVSLSASALGDVQAAQTLTLPCGEYYLDAIKTGAAGMLTLRVQGHVGIFVAGDVQLQNSLIVALDDGATLDLVVAKTFVVTSGSLFGAPTNPAGTRLWVGGNTIALPSTPFQFLAFVYAPGAFFSAGPLLDFSGSLFVGTLSLSVAKDLHIGYDPAVMQAGGECGVRPTEQPQ